MRPAVSGTAACWICGSSEMRLLRRGTCRCDCSRTRFVSLMQAMGAMATSTSARAADFASAPGWMGYWPSTSSWTTPLMRQRGGIGRCRLAASFAALDRSPAAAACSISERAAVSWSRRRSLPGGRPRAWNPASTSPPSRRSEACRSARRIAACQDKRPVRCHHAS